MKASKFLAISAFLSAINLSAWAQTIKITIVRDVSPTASIPASAEYIVVAGQSRTFDHMQTLAFAPTSGDCTMVDTSKLERQGKSGEVLRLATTTPVQGNATVQIEFEQRKFLGATPFKFNQSCTVNNPSSDVIKFEQTVLLRVGAPPFLLHGVPGLKIFGVVVP